MLTQAEIDALLTGAIEVESRQGEGTVNLAEIINQSGGNGKDADKDKKVQAYNFWSPDRFSKEQMRAVELVHEEFAERLTTSLPSFLRVSLRPRLVHTEQGRFHDFLKDCPPNSLFHMIKLAPLPGQMVMTTSPEISMKILEQRLGGKIETGSRERGLTDIDQSLLRGLVEHMLNDLKAAWAKVAAIEPALEDSTVNQHWVQMLLGNERVMLITFEMSIQNSTGIMNVYIPFSMLKPIANVLNPHVWISGRKEKVQDPVSRQVVFQSMKEVQLPIRVYLGKVDVALKDLINLAEGDVLQLNTSLNDNLIMQVAELTRFEVKVGKSGKHLAVQVDSVIHDEQNE
ncbi:MAG TPA: flagellar motor switch protein FliM [Anaerolineaceae bacterium]|nr:flagellar motor switch protein FliM [Anaerolineaceae bacterium]